MPNIVTIKELADGSLIVTEYTGAQATDCGYDLAGMEFHVPAAMVEDFERDALFGIFAGRFTVLSGRLAERFEAVLNAHGDRIITKEEHGPDCQCPPEMRHGDRLASLERMFTGSASGHAPEEA